MPTPTEGETEPEYMKRCMSYPDMQKYEPEQRAAICHSKFSEASTKALPFARFPDMTSCTSEMGKLGHLKVDCLDICNGILQRAMNNALLKANDQGLEVLCKAENGDIIVGGYASWDVEDDQGDTFSVEAQSKALQRFFSLPPEYQLETVDHGMGHLKEFKAAQPILKYTNTLGKTFYSHVNEIGTYLVSKLRSDKSKATEYIRQKALNGEISGYSVAAIPLERDPQNPKRVVDMEYNAVTLAVAFKPVNPKTRDVKVISKSEAVTPTQTTQNMPLVDVEAILEKHGFNKTVQ